MRIHPGWFTFAVATLCLIGGVSSVVNSQFSATDQDEVAITKPLHGDAFSRSDSENVSLEAENERPTAKDADAKSASGAKKKNADFKPKTDQKYQKPTVKEEKGDEVSRSEPVTKSTTLTSTIDDESVKKIVKDKHPVISKNDPVLSATTTESTTTTKSTEDANASMTSRQIPESTTELGPPKARALDVTAPEPTNSLHGNVTDLSDVSMDDEDKTVEGGHYVIPQNGPEANMSLFIPATIPKSTCMVGNTTYVVGEKISQGCEDHCMCGEGGVLTDCQPVCQKPFVRAGKKVTDPYCHARNIPEMPCCAMLICTDSAPEPDETCVFGNTTLMRGQKVEDGCEKVCLCEAAGHLKCQPRCPPNDTTSGKNQHDSCVVLSDPRDSCCTITLCDVTLGDFEIKPESPAELSVNLTDVKVLNSTAIKLKLSSKSHEDISVELSENNHDWKRVKPSNEGIISNLQPAHSYYIRLVEGSHDGPVLHVSLSAEVTKTHVPEKDPSNEEETCFHRDKTYEIGEEWHDECIAICYCNETAHVQCATIECPTDFGLDVLDPHCLEWETVPPNHVPKAPNCCPHEVLCKSNGSCIYEGKMYENWNEIPSNVTGCEKKCYCELGKVTCEAACPPVTALPPPNMPCAPHEAILMHLPSDECCLQWVCPRTSMKSPGKNTTSANSSPLPTDSKPNNKSDMSKPIEEPGRGTSSYWETRPEKNNSHTETPNHEIIHYPMDPGHPTVPYNGPYNPDFKPTQPSVEDIFHLPVHTEKTPPTKDKSKSKTESKKPVDSFKPHKEVIDPSFPGPLSPNHFLEKPSSPIRPNNDQISPSIPKPNKLPSPHKGTDHGVDQPQFIPLNVHDASGPKFDFAPTNGENIPPSNFDTFLENPAAGPAYGRPVVAKPDIKDPNHIVPSGSKKKVPGDSFPGDKGKPSANLPSRRPDVPHRNPNQDDITDELYHLINMRHPGLIQFDNHGNGDRAPSLYDIHQQITGQKKPLNGQIPPNYFGPPPPPPPTGNKKGLKPQIFTQQDENGQTTYHVHASQIPTSPEQIQELIDHIAQHDTNAGSYPHYPIPPSIPHNIPNGPPPLSPHVEAHAPQSAITHLNHPFAAQTPNQSGFEQSIAQLGQFPGLLGHAIPGNQQADEITVEVLQPISASTVRLMFTVPPVLVGLHGRVEVRYTNDKTSNDPATWKSQTFAPPGDLIDTEELEFDLGGLKPSTDYKLMIVLKLRDLANTHTSKIYQVRTLDKPTSDVPSELNIDYDLRVVSANSTTAELEWKKFTNFEMQFIDGVYVMYKPENDHTFALTPLLHRSVNYYVLDNLIPSTTYEIQLSTKDFVGQTTTLINTKVVKFTTSPQEDPYTFDVKVDIKTIKSTDVEVSWSGVPKPEDKYVNIYRAVYQSDSGKEDSSTFKIAKKDSPAKTLISDLKPGTRYRMWIEVYLTNGKIKKSNVQDFVTKPGVLVPSGASTQGKLASIPLHDGDYYGPLVIVAIVASLSILSTLILLMMLMKRRTSSKADISPRKTTSAYDNPSYKVELQQETLDL